MSSFIIGATIVAVGTSLPELVSSLYAVIGTGETSFVADAVIGSNIANALLILGIGALMAGTLKVTTSLIDIDLPFFFMSAGLFAFFAMDKVILWQEGVFLLLFFVIFVVYSIRSKPEGQDRDEMEDFSDEYDDAHEKRIKKKTIVIFKYIGLIIVSMGLVAVSSKYFIDSLLMLSELFGVSSALLTVSVVAIGTSLPEILTSIAAIRAGNHGMAIGNVFGSNIFNLTFIVGIPSLFSTLSIDPTTFAIGIPFLLFATVTTFFVTQDDQIRLWEGVAMLLIYIVFLAKILGWI